MAADETPGRVAATLSPIRETLHVAEEQGLAEWDDAYIPSALYRHAASLLAAVEAALKLADDWAADSFIVDPEISLRAAITTALTGTPVNDSAPAAAVREDEGP